MKKFLAFVAAAFFASAAYGQNAGTVTNHAFAIGKGPNVSGYTSLLCGPGQLAVGSATDPVCRTVSGDITLSPAGVATLAAVNPNIGSFGSATQCVTLTVNAKGLITAASAAACGTSGANPTATATTTANNGAAATFMRSDASPAVAVTTFGGQTVGPGGTAAVQGSGGKVQLSTGTTVGGHNAVYDASGNVVDSGAVPNAGTVTSVACNGGLTGGTFTGSGTCALALNSAVLAGAPATPASFTATSPGVMMGLGVTTCRFTPTYSTRAEFYIYGQIANNTAGNADAITLKFGTGAGPANGVATTGTTLGTGVTFTSGTASSNLGFWVGGIATGLTAGTTYWLDLAAFVNAGTGTVSSVTCNAKEIL